MRFWIRHIILIVLCVVLPLGAALYFDTASEKDRAREVGASTVRVASRGLETALSLRAHEEVARAMSLSQRITDLGALSDLSRGGSRGEDALAKTVALLDAASTDGHFAWVVDESGAVLLRNGQTAADEEPSSVAGHPMFVETQFGHALDGVWDDRERLVLAAAAPLVVDGAAAGAVVLGHEIDGAAVNKLSSAVESEVSLIVGDKVVATSFPPAIANEIALPATTREPVFGGRRDEPLPQFNLPVLPLLIDHHADGIAYASAARPVLGSIPSVRWVVSVDSSGTLAGLAQRQEIIFAVLAAALLLALLIGLVNHRTFVRPIDKLAEHLSEIQLGRGELEMPESRVSKPFRRLVRLINMTVQRMPTRGLSGIGTSDVGFADSGRAASRTGSLVLHPSSSSPPVEARPPNPEPTPPPPEPEPVPEPPEPEPAVAESRAASFGVPPDLEPSLPPPPSSDLVDEEDDVDEAAAIAEAIASLESGQSLKAPPQPRAASEVRGRAVANEGMPSPFAPSQSEFLREGSSLSGPSQDDPAPPSKPAPGVRGGGSLDLSGYAGVNEDSADVDEASFGPEATVVAPVAEDLLAQSARDDLTDHHHVFDGDEKPDMTVVASVPADLLAQSAGEAPIPDPPPPPPRMENGLDAADRAHFEEVYDRFLDMRRRCGEKTADLAFDRFLKKLTKNRENLIKKYHCRTVRFQVYEKDGKAALKATPVRAR